MSTKPVIGWREWVRLPLLGNQWVKAKIDTGARSSALHAFDAETYEVDGQEWVRFTLHPNRKSAKGATPVTAPVIGRRLVKSSNGAESNRLLVVTRFELGGQSWPIELTLANRTGMAFRMLVGREAMRRRYLVDPGRSYVFGSSAVPSDRLATSRG